MGLKAHLRSGVAAISIAALVAPAGFAGAEGARPAAQALNVRVAEAKDFSRIEFRWAGGAKYVAKRDGQTVVLRFSRYAPPDMTRLRVDPPKWLKTAADRNAGGGLELTLTLADGADAKWGEGDGAIFVNLFAAKAPEPAAPAKPPEVAATAVATQPPKSVSAPDLSSRPNPTPDSGVVKMRAEMNNGQVSLHFPWKAPLGAAVFRRGEAVWVVFDAAAKLDISGAPHGFRQVQKIQVVQGPDFAAVRIVAPPDIAASATGQGSEWTVTLGQQGQPGAPIKITRDDAAPTATLTAAVAGSTKVVWLDDPVVGDRLAAVTALGPAKGLASQRTYVDMTLLPSAQGLGVQTAVDDLSISTDGDLVSLGRPRGLALSPKSAHPVEAVSAGLPRPASRPGLINFADWSQTGDQGFLKRYDELQAGAAQETGGGKDTSVSARMALARFLVGSELSFEAIGVLDLTAKAQQNLLSNAEFRGLRGAARVMAGRYKEAETDFSSPTLQDDAASSLWRGFIATKLGQWAEARQAFAAGAPALYQFDGKWRARFARADAESALELKQFPVADSAIQTALGVAVDPAEQMDTRLIQARLLEAEGQKPKALAIFDELAKCNIDSLAAPAQLHATRIRLDDGKMTPLEAAGIYDQLRYRWRGDATELDTIRALGQIYLSLGRYREALEALRSAGKRLPDLPEAVELQSDLQGAFRNLFLEGAADGLQPIQALALFYDFRELTPIGADGDLMVRKLARRLIDVDLLSQAADLLKYQADNRLDGVPRAEVDTDLATIDLMNRKPEDALAAINASRTSLLPSALSAQRRVVEARAWLQLGQYDHAMEILGADASNDAAAIRGEVAWKQHNWTGAGAIFEKMLGDRFKTQSPLSGEEEAKLLRAGIAYSLAGDDASLGRLRDHYQGFVAGAHSPDALRVALTGLGGGALSGSDFAKATAENDSFAGWVQAMKQRFRERPTTSSGQASTSGKSTKG
jgi:tetratricopeptide (TPR) repeat protein